MKKFIGIIVFIGFIIYIGKFKNTKLKVKPSKSEEQFKDTTNLYLEDTIEFYDPCPNYEDNSNGELVNTTDTILRAIMFVESSYNDSAYHKGEDAVGCLQIRKCMVDDINRILKRKKLTLRFTYNSRWSRDSSIQMFGIYCNHYNLTTAEEMARCWNGGPRGINNPSTVGYWEKVKDKINS